MTRINVKFSFPYALNRYIIQNKKRDKPMGITVSEAYNPKSPNLDLDTPRTTKKGLLSYVDTNIGLWVREEYFDGVQYWLPKGINKISEKSVQARITRIDGTKYSKAFSASTYSKNEDPLAAAISAATDAIIDVRAKTTLQHATKLFAKINISFAKVKHQSPVVNLNSSQMLNRERISNNSMTYNLSDLDFLHLMEGYFKAHELLLTNLALAKSSSEQDAFFDGRQKTENQLLVLFTNEFNKAIKSFEERVFGSEVPTFDDMAGRFVSDVESTSEYIHLKRYRTAPARVIQREQYAGFEDYSFPERIAVILMKITEGTPEPTWKPPRKLTSIPHPTSGIVGVSVAVDNRRGSLAIYAHLRYRGSGKGNDKKTFYVSKHGLEMALRLAVSESRTYFWEPELTESEFSDLYYKFRCHILPRLPDEMIKTVAKELRGISVVTPKNPVMIGARRTTKPKRTLRKRRKG